MQQQNSVCAPGSTCSACACILAVGALANLPRGATNGMNVDMVLPHQAKRKVRTTQVVNALMTAYARAVLPMFATVPCQHISAAAAVSCPRQGLK